MPRQVIDQTDSRVRVDRTSQLLISMSIAIAETVKTYVLRNLKKEEQEESTRTLTGFENIVKKSVIDKS